MCHGLSEGGGGGKGLWLFPISKKRHTDKFGLVFNTAIVTVTLTSLDVTAFIGRWAGPNRMRAIRPQTTATRWDENLRFLQLKFRQIVIIFIL